MFPPVYPTALPFRQVVDKRHHEVNAVIGGPAPSLYGGKDRYTAASQDSPDGILGADVFAGK